MRAQVGLLASSEVDPQRVADAFRELQQQTPQPRILAEQIYDGSIPIFFAVLHDGTATADEDPQRLRLGSIESALNSTYGSGSSQLLEVLGGGWQKGMAAFMKDFAATFVVPSMERRVRTLWANIAAQRKGLKNQWKSWFGGQRPAAEREGVTLIEGRPPVYTHVALESQIRQFSDLAFMLHDFELALQNYRLVCADYKKDKANKCAAGAMEMIGTCLVLHGASQREAEQCLLEAIDLYQRERATAYASRSSLLLYDCLQQWNRQLGASRTLLTSSDHETENNARAAIMLELAGQCFLRMQPAQYRKYAFYLVLAGYRYNLAQQRRHTVRCYATALHLYSSNGWSHVEDHLNFALGRQHKSLHLYSDAMGYLVDLLSGCQQPAERQEAFLKEFLHVTELRQKQRAEEAPPMEIKIPAVLDETVQVRANELPAAGGAAAAAGDAPSDPLAFFHADPLGSNQGASFSSRIV